MGSHQDRFFDRAAAAPRKSPSQRNTSYEALPLAQWFAAFASIVVAGGTFMGIFPQNPATADIFHLVLPCLVAPLVAVCFAYGWHHWLAVCAEDAPTRKHVIALCFGALMTAAGIALSGINLVSFLEGDKAQSAYQQEGLEKLRQVGAVVKANAADEAPLLASVEQGAGALRTSAASENNRSVVRKTKPGMGSTFNSVSDAALNVEKVFATMRQQVAERDRLLKAAETALGEARRASEAGDADKFADAYGRAAAAVGNADKIHLSSTASAIGLGLALDRASAPFVNETFANIDKVRLSVNSDWRPVVVPNFESITAHQAVRRNPGSSFLGWATSFVVEILPWSFMPILLTLARRKHDDDEAPEQDTWLPPFVATRSEPRPNHPPTLVAAE
jgi:hypothetical protein